MLYPSPLHPQLVHGVHSDHRCMNITPDPCTDSSTSHPDFGIWDEITSHIILVTVDQACSNNVCKSAAAEVIVQVARLLLHEGRCHGCRVQWIISGLQHVLRNFVFDNLLISMMVKQFHNWLFIQPIFRERVQTVSWYCWCNLSNGHVSLLQTPSTAQGLSPLSLRKVKQEAGCQNLQI